MMLALSTSCLSGVAENGDSLVNALENLDICAVELEYRISDAVFRRIMELLPQTDIRISSIHNYCPIPPSLTASNGGGDLYLLSSPDLDERKQAVFWTNKTIDHAANLGAKAVVLHCGYVQMDMELDRLYTFFNTNQIQTAEAQTFILRKFKERERLKPLYLDSLLSSLEQLARQAEKKGILLGIENRYHYRELPTLEDFDTIFKRFEGGPLGYWHDTGHAFVNESLTLIPAGSLLNAYSENLIGVHFHDAKGLNDHLVPASGEIDFQKITVNLKEDTLKVLELKPGTPDSEISRAIRFAREKFL
jgi:sugar phosphate isomerase/epimerase